VVIYQPEGRWVGQIRSEVDNVSWQLLFLRKKQAARELIDFKIQYVFVQFVIENEVKIKMLNWHNGKFE